MSDDDHTSGTHGAPGWVVTFGDMISLLLTFFIMLVAYSRIRDNPGYQAARKSIQSTLGVSSPRTPPDHAPLSTLESTLRELVEHGGEEARTAAGATAGLPGNDISVTLQRPPLPVPAGPALQFPFSREFHSLPAWTSANELALQESLPTIQGKPQRVEIRCLTPSNDSPNGPLALSEINTLAWKIGRDIHRRLVSSGIEPQRLSIIVAQSSKSADEETLPPSPSRPLLHIQILLEDITSVPSAVPETLPGT